MGPRMTPTVALHSRRRLAGSSTPLQLQLISGMDDEVLSMTQTLRLRGFDWWALVQGTLAEPATRC